MGRPLAQHPLEAEHQAEPDLPLVGRLAAAGFHLRHSLVERAAAGRVGREHNRRILVRMEERLSGPGFGLEGGGD